MQMVRMGSSGWPLIIGRTGREGKAPAEMAAGGLAP